MLKTFRKFDNIRIIYRLLAITLKHCAIKPVLNYVASNVNGFEQQASNFDIEMNY